MNKKLISIFAVTLVTLAVAGLIVSERGEATPADKSSTAKPEAAAAPSEKKSDEKAASSAEDPVVAKVDGQPVLRSEVLAFMKNIPPQMQQLPPETLFPILARLVNPNAPARLNPGGIAFRILFF